MNLALGIVCFWIGCALLTVAFHPLPLESGTGSPSDVIRALQRQASKNNSAYSAAAATAAATTPDTGTADTGTGGQIV